MFILINNQLLSNYNAKAFNTDCCFYDFRNESSGIFVLGVFFFRNFDFLTSHFCRDFYIIQKALLSGAKIWKDISPVIIFRTVVGVKKLPFWPIWDS